MSPSLSPPASRKLAFLSALFILLFFLFFTYTALSSYFTFDDGTTIIVLLKPFDVSLWRDLLHILTVFTPAFRPITNLFWKPMLAIFGFNPLPYRIVVHLLLMVNIGLAYLLARRLELTREAAVLATLVFCYNASESIMLYDTCMVDIVICLLFYALAVMAYVGGRQTGQPLGWRRILVVAVTFGLALDSKEVAVTLPGVLLLYELLYRYRDLRNRRTALRVGGMLATMFVACAIYSRVKVTYMARIAEYRPNVDAHYILTNLGGYIETLLYLPEKSVPALKACLIVLGFLAAAALVRSRQAVFGVLFFVAVAIPVSVIPNRGGYAMYVAFFGLAMAVGAILASARSHLTRWFKLTAVETKTAVALFVVTALLLGWAHMNRRVQANGYYEWDKPKLVTLMQYFRRTIPEFPPHARVLVTDNVWGPDWGMMFLLQLMYHDKDLWLDRPTGTDRPPDPSSYDLVVSYKTPDIDMQPARFFNFPMKWEIRGYVVNSGQFLVSSPNAHGAPPRVDFSPQAVRSSQSTTVTIPGVSNTAVNALFRIVSGTKSTPYVVNNWCTVDDKGKCTVTAPSAGTMGAMVLDWIQPVNQRWIFTSGVLTIVD